MVLSVLGALVIYGPDLIFGEPRIVVTPLTMLMNNIEYFRHGISAELEETHEPKALWVCGVEMPENSIEFKRLLIALYFVKIFRY
jgi:hypothetical protein